MSKGIAPELFEHEMVTTTKVLGRETGVEVVIGGSEAKTDGKKGLPSFRVEGQGHQP
jgi:hypothetical protein